MEIYLWFNIVYSIHVGNLLCIIKYFKMFTRTLIVIICTITDDIITTVITIEFYFTFFFITAVQGIILLSAFLYRLFNYQFDEQFLQSFMSFWIML